jgi:DnaJ family protein B protein 4
LGHQDEDGNASDLTLIIQQQQHRCYKRIQNDLHLTISIPLVTALTGGEVAVTQLDGRVLHVHLVEVVTPGVEVVVAGEGMPIQGQPHRRGNMHLHFEVKFPVGLGVEQQQQLRQALEETV